MVIEKLNGSVAQYSIVLLLLSITTLSGMGEGSLIQRIDGNGFDGHVAWILSGITSEQSQFENSEALFSTSMNTSDIPISGRSFTKSVLEALQHGKGIDEAMRSAGFMPLLYDNKAIPTWLEEELLDLDRFKDAYINSDHTIVNLSLTDSLNASRDHLTTMFESKGWDCLIDEASNSFTAVKKRGICKWIMVELIQVGEETSIVLHIQHA